jgi:threonine dehydratase
VVNEVWRLMDVDLDLTRIEEAARTADPVFRDSPQFVSEQLCAALGRNVLVKIETANPLGSFKGRGAGFLVRSLPPGSTIVCASSGNFGVALAYAARIRGMGAHVYVSPGTSTARLARMQALGAAVSVADGDAAQAARAHVAAHPGCVLANNHPAVAEGAGAATRIQADTCRADTTKLGYDTQWASLRASDAGAAHRRDRLFILGWQPAALPRLLSAAHPGGRELQRHRVPAILAGPPGTAEAAGP